MRFISECEVLSNDSVAPGHFRMRLRAPEIARAACPGQFGMLQVVEGYSPFLRRPMSFERILSDSVSILYKVEGEGTRLLTKLLPGQAISLQGPLGNGFPIDAGFDRHIIVAGGVGVAPFPALAEVLAEVCGTPPEVVLAARTKDFLVCEEEFRRMGCSVYLATDDGSAGDKAYAAEMLERLTPARGTRVYACGPMAMMRTTSEAAMAAGADCLVSLEAQMACGDGACLGCVVEAKHQEQGSKMMRVCVDGPVFDAGLIDWEAYSAAHGR